MTNLLGIQLQDYARQGLLKEAGAHLQLLAEVRGLPTRAAPADARSPRELDTSLRVDTTLGPWGTTYSWGGPGELVLGR